MADPTSIITAVATLKTAIDIVKAIRSADVSLDKAEAKLQLAQLYELLADLRMQVVEAREAMSEKDSKINELIELLDFKGRLKRVGDAYFEVDENNTTFGDPFCSPCIELGRKPVHLTQDFDHYVCGSCGGIFQSGRIAEAAHMRHKL